MQQCLFVCSTVKQERGREEIHFNFKKQKKTKKLELKNKLNETKRQKTKNKERMKRNMQILSNAIDDDD